MAALLLAGVLAGCDEKNEQPAPERFASVKKSEKGAANFCEKSFPASGDGVKPFVRPAFRTLAGAPELPKPDPKQWTWVNLWATWCTPCVEEMGLLERWHQAAARENLPVHFELYSIDDETAEPKLQQWKAKTLAGPIGWLKSEDELFSLLDRLGIERTAAIPIHVLVDPNGNVRCVRVGAIHEQNWGAVKSLLSGS